MDEVVRERVVRPLCPARMVRVGCNWLAKRTRGRSAGALASILLATIGCAEELGPEPMPTAHVSGRVHIRGMAVGHGWIEFHPVEGTVGVLRSARLHPDGTFSTGGVAVGRNGIQIVPPGFLPREFGDLERAAIVRREIKPIQDNHLDIDLQDELLRYLRERPAL